MKYIQKATHARTHRHTQIHTHTPVFRPSWILSGTTRMSRYKKVKPVALIYFKQNEIHGVSMTYIIYVHGFSGHEKWR